MTGMNARTTVKYTFEATATGTDGYTVTFQMDDSLKGWWSIVRWNWHYRHWHALSGNGRDLFTKILWRKLWRRS